MTSLQREQMEAKLFEAFVNHALDNRGVLTSTRHARPLISQIYGMAESYLIGESADEAVYDLAVQLAERGLAVTSARALLTALDGADWTDSVSDVLLIQSRLSGFQLHFFAGLAGGREQASLQEHEASQHALQHALHAQLQQQRALQQEQEERTNSLQNILQLNAALASVQSEEELLSQATSGLCVGLRLADVTVYQWRRLYGWACRMTTSDRIVPTEPIPAGTTTLLDQVLADPAGELIHDLTDRETTCMRVITRIQAGTEPLGAIVVHQDHHDPNLPILLQTFALNLSALWRNLQLLLEAQQRTQELEILHGRHIDSIWQTGQMMIDASYSDSSLQLARHVPQALPRQTNGSPNIPVTVGDKPLGNIFLPEDMALSEEDNDFVQTLVREMGSALNNAHLLQTTRAYSLQLRTAVEVSRVVSTILDQAKLMQEVVELIQRRFEFYFVAIYLVDEGEAVLRAGSTPAGEALVAKKHHIPIFGTNPVSRAIQHNRPIIERNIQQPDHPHLPLTNVQLALPLRARGNIIGVLVTDGTDNDAFSDEEVTVLQTLSDQIAVAIDNASLFTQVQENFVLTNQLYQAGRQIISAPNADTIFQAIVDFAASTGLVDMAHFFLSSPGSPDEFLATNVWTRLNVPIPPAPFRVIRSRFLTSPMVVSGEVVVIRDAFNDERVDSATRRSFKANGVRSATLVPVVADEQWLGTLALDRVETGVLTDQQLQPFLSLCAQAGVALTNLQLLRETDALYRVGQSLNQAITADDALRTTLLEIANYMGLEQAQIVRYDPQIGSGRVVVSLTPEAGVQEIDEDASLLSFQIAEDALFSRLSLSAKPVNVSIDEPLEEEARAYLEHYSAPAAVLVPILGQQILMGFLAIESKSSEYTFDQPTLNFVENAAAQLATFLENITLFEETALRAQELVSLNQIGSLLAGILDLDKLIHVLYERVGDLLDNTIFLVALYDEEQQFYTPLLHIIEDNTVSSAPFQLEEDTQLTRFLRAGFPLQGADAITLAVAQHAHPQRSPQSAVWVSWQQEGIPAGLISIQSYQPNAYSDTDTQLLRTVATQAGLAITNAQLFQQTQENVAELRTLFNVAQAGAVSVNADERLNEMVYALHESLRQADVAILLHAPDTSALQTLAQYTQTTGLITTETWVEDKLSNQVVKTGQALLVNNLTDLEDYNLDAPKQGAQLIIPLTLGQRAIGVVRANSPHVNAFTQRDLRLLETLSISLAATIESNRLFAEIQTANEQLRELDRLKTRFLANMSHELRTPLNSIIGFSGIILKGIDGPITPDQKQDLTAINKSGQHLLMLINEILDMGKIEAGKMTLLIERIDVREVADNVLATIRGLVDEKPVTLHWDIEPDLPLIDADQIRVRQIMLNLLSNAVKYTYEGSITCKISHENEHIHITVADTGIGIAEQDFSKLFRAFEQVDDSSTRSIQGTGLGLPITQSLVQMHQGEIWLESEIGKGTTFYVRLPIRLQGEVN